MKKKKIEFSKILVILAIVIFAGYGIYSGMRYYSLVQLAIETGENSCVTPDPALAVTCVGGILGSILTYILYQGSLKWSLNANKLTVDQATGVVSKILDGDPRGVILDIVEENQTDDDETNSTQIAG